MAESHTLVKINCSSCNADTSQLYIQCMECRETNICLQCFASGTELDNHSRFHKYMFVDNGTFPLFEPEWCASEEQQLIDSVEQFGLGNWEDVAENVGSKTAKEVEEHYMTVYINSFLGQLTVPQDIPNRMTDHTPPLHESVFSIPLKPVNVSREQQLELAYMPSRDDFEYEFDNDAESLVSAIFMNPDDDELDRGLKLAKVEMYHSKLKERQRRKDIAREYKLVERFFGVADSKHPAIQKSDLRSKLKCCCQFMKYEQYAQLTASILKERRLRRRISRLRNCRKNGVTKLEGINAFEHASYLRWKKQQSSGKASKDEITLRLIAESGDSSKFPDLCRLPRFDVLSDSEKLQCLSMKMSPANYITSKILILKDAALKNCGLHSKSRASAIIEKSQRRRITNFLQEQGWMP